MLYIKHSLLFGTDVYIRHFWRNFITTFVLDILLPQPSEVIINQNVPVFSFALFHEPFGSTLRNIIHDLLDTPGKVCLLEPDLCSLCDTIVRMIWANAEMNALVVLSSPILP